MNTFLTNSDFLNITTSPNRDTSAIFKVLETLVEKTIEKFTIVWNFSYSKEVHIEYFLRSNDSFMTFKMNSNETQCEPNFCFG